MNTQYFIYAIEVEKTGSITQAANNLFMSQPTLSKAIRDMEAYTLELRKRIAAARERVAGVVRSYL